MGDRDDWVDICESLGEEDPGKSLKEELSKSSKDDTIAGLERTVMSLKEEVIDSLLKLQERDSRIHDQEMLLLLLRDNLLGKKQASEAVMKVVEEHHVRSKDSSLKRRIDARDQRHCAAATIQRMWWHRATRVVHKRLSSAQRRCAAATIQRMWWHRATRVAHK